MEAALNERGQRFRTAIAGFIEVRREAKEKAKNYDPGKFDYATWLADAAHRVGQIQAVTHVLKATHPDARGTSLHMDPSRLPSHAEIGSHNLGPDHAVDVVGNAAALDVFKFLKIEVDGHPLLHWMQTHDPDLQSTLSSDADQAMEWMQAFTSLIRTNDHAASHALAKQVYWLVGEEPPKDSDFHLLQPLFSSPLAHAVHQDIQDARFGDANKQARKAFRAGDEHEGTYRDYRNLVARKLGGTKPQNISQLNSERGGVNYLLPSLPPPVWKPHQGPKRLKRDSALDELLWFGTARTLLRELGKFLQTKPDRTMDTRNRIDTFAEALGDELAIFGATLRAHYPAGWTREDDCDLPLCEQLWLDPDRSELPLRDDPEHPEWRQADAAFNEAYARGDWADEIAARFGLWLNGQLRKRHRDMVVLGEAEMRYWAGKAILDVAWPIPLQRRAPVQQEVSA